MYLFYNLTIKSLERPHWCNSAVIIGSFNYVLRVTYCWLWRPHCICLEQCSIGKCPKIFEASGIHYCILNNTQFLKTSHWNQKISSGTSALAKKKVYAKCTFVWWWLCIPSFRTIVYVVDKQSGICRRYILLQGLCVPSVKSTTYVWNKFKVEFFFSNLNGQFWTKSTLIWMGFPGVHFYPLASKRPLWKPYFYLNSLTYLASCINHFFNRSLF